MIRSRRLPGLRFDVVAPELQRRLPRTDVAGFVGLAARGPVDVPVPVENTGQFAMIFGDDAVVTVPGAAGATRRSQLGTAVRAFFENGGRRAWVVRVCGEATRGTVTLPGVYRVAASGAVDRPKLVARSVGAWSDGLRLTAIAEPRPIRLTDARTDGVTVTAVAAPDVALQAGDLVLHRSINLAWVVTRVAAAAAGHPGAPAPGREVLGTGAWRLRTSGPTPQSAPRIFPADAEILTLGLRADDGSAVAGLGFHPAHPRYWRHLPTDERLFSTDEQRFGAAHAPDLRLSGSAPANERAARAAAIRALWTEIADPRLPWAAADVDDDPYATGGAFELPGRELIDDGAEAATADVQADPAWSRDGLRAFERRWFLDPDLTATSEPALPAAIDAVTSLAARPRRLRGAHALWPIDEISLIAAPDLAQPAWVVNPPNTRKRVLPSDGGFHACAPTDLPKPTWIVANGGSHALDWWASGAPSGARWRLERASTADFLDPEPVALVTATTAEVPGGNAGWFRVRAEHAGEAGPWSAVLEVTHSAGALDPADPTPSLAAVQHGLLRLCAARGDLLAVLSLPDTDGDVPPDLGDLGSFSATALPLLGSERRALSHGAVFHPWLWVDDPVAGPRRAPPDGAILGVFAARALAAGAWHVPANTPLRRVSGPVWQPSDAQRSRWDPRINPMLRAAHGTVTLGEATLSEARDTDSIAVRRLLSLIRRLALREGQALVFEPDAPAFRRAVKAAFDQWLGELFRRGAFAGATPTEAFRVDVSGNRDLGRFEVDLRVAPSRPLAFLTVRLVRTDHGASAVEGA